MIGRDSQILKNPKKNLSELTRIIDDTKNAIFLASAERNFCVFFVSSLMWENCLRELTPSMFRRNKKNEKKIETIFDFVGSIEKSLFHHQDQDRKNHFCIGATSSKKQNPNYQFFHQKF